MPKSIAIALVSVLAISACGEPRDTGPGQPVAHRQTAFKEILKAFEPMGVMLRSDNYDPNQFKAWSKQLSVLRDVPWGYFGADTQYPPSHATPEVWSNGEKFAAEKQAFMDATDKLTAIAGTPDKRQAAVAYEAVESSCRSCHKTFKKR